MKSIVSDAVREMCYFSCSDKPRYQGIDTGRFVQQLVSMDVIAEQPLNLVRPKRACSTTKHFVRLDVGSKVEVFDTVVQPQLVLWNSYNGESSFQARLGFYRFVCSNGMTIGTELAAVRLRHVVGQRWDSGMAKFVEDLKALSETGLQEHLEPFAARITTSQACSILDRLQMSGRISLRLSNDVKAILVHELAREEDRTGRLWDVWNILNECMRHASRSALRFEERNTNLGQLILQAAA